MYASSPKELRKLLNNNPGSSPSQHLDDSSFASFCLDNKSIRELKRALNGDADKDECMKWGLSHEEWRINTEMALIAKMY